MRKYLLIGIAGGVGAVLRYVVKNMSIYNYHENIPLNTLIINVSGSFLLAFFLALTFEIINFNSELRLAIATGFLGAYTTFSTLCKETVEMMREGLYFSAISYVTVSTVLGLIFVYFGIVASRELVIWFRKRHNKAAISEIVTEEPEGDVE